MTQSLTHNECKGPRSGCVRPSSGPVTGRARARLGTPSATGDRHASWRIRRAAGPLDRGVTGYAPQHDVMGLASEVRLLRETIVKLRDQLDNLGALLTVAGDSLRPEWRKRRTERKS